MHISTMSWTILIVLVVGLLVFDFVSHVRDSHSPSLREATFWSVTYIILALAFGVGIWRVYSLDLAVQYWAGWMTEWSLSLDNLFVFLIIFSSFKVPRQFQQKVLLIGISLALLFRGIFIVLGSAIIAQFSWVFYIFGAFLIYTAISQLKTNDDEEEYTENRLTILARRIFPTTKEYKGDKLIVRINKKIFITPMMIVVIAVGTADIMFAFDSIPAIFGLTKEAYIVFAANAFSLLGLRQFFFLIDQLMEKLSLLNYGLAVILGFIGVKLLIHAASTNTLWFINSGQPIEGLYEPSTTFSMIFIVSTLVITAILSIIHSKYKTRKTTEK